MSFKILDAEYRQDLFPVSERETGGSGLRVLVVDDEPGVGDFLRDAICRLGHRVVICSSGAQALARAATQPFDMVLLDINMPGMNGVEVLVALRQKLPNACFAMITGKMDSELTGAALSKGAILCLAKPLTLSELEGALGMAATRPKGR